MRIRVAHISLQFSDTAKQVRSDVTRIFDRAKARNIAWVLGTEAGPQAGNGQTANLLRDIGRKAGYRMFIPSLGGGPGQYTDCWIAVRNDLIKGNWKTTYIPVIPGSQQLYRELKVDPASPKWMQKGLVTAEFDSLPELGNINLVVTHHLTRGATKGRASIIHGVDHYALNQKMDRAITKWVAEHAKGSALVFGSTDKNASDRRKDSIDGTTTLADELKKWQNTGHGDIDWMFSANKDTRVKGVSFKAYNDREFALHTDHYFLEGVYNVAPRRR